MGRSLQVLATELAKAEYDGLDAEQMLARLKEGVPTDRATVPSIEVLGAIRPADWPTGDNLVVLQILLANAEIPLGEVNIRNDLKGMFTGKTQTLAAISALEKANRERGELAGFSSVTMDDVIQARKMI